MLTLLAATLRVRIFGARLFILLLLMVGGVLVRSRLAGAPHDEAEYDGATHEQGQEDLGRAVIECVQVRVIFAKAEGKHEPGTRQDVHHAHDKPQSRGLSRGSQAKPVDSACKVPRIPEDDHRDDAALGAKLGLSIDDDFSGRED